MVSFVLQHEIFPLGREQEKALEAEGLLKLACEKYQFQDSNEKPLHHGMEIGDAYCSSKEQGRMHLKVNLVNLLDVLQKVTDVDDLGLQLGVPKHELDKIRQDCHTMEEQKRQVLQWWLNHTPNPT